MRGAPGRRRDEGGGNQYVTGGAGGRVFAVERGNQYVWAQSGAADYWVSPESWGAPVLTGSSVDRVPSRLLAARYQVVPFTGRSAELSALGAWAAGPAPVAVRAVVGVGGQGKTRLVTRFAQALASAGGPSPAPVTGNTGSPVRRLPTQRRRASPTSGCCSSSTTPTGGPSRTCFRSSPHTPR